VPPAELRSTRDGSLVRTLSGPADGGWFEASSGGTIAVVSGTAGGVELVRATDGRQIGALESSDFLVAGTGAEERLVARDRDGGRCFVRMLSTETRLGEPRPCSNLEPSADRSTVAFHRDGRGGSILRVADGALLTELPEDATLRMFSPDGSLIVIEGEDTGALLLQTDGGRVIAELDAPIAPFFEDTEEPSLAFSADGRFLYASTSGSARLYDTRTGRAVELDVPPGLGVEDKDTATVQFGPEPLDMAYVRFADGSGALVRLPELRVVAPLDVQAMLQFWPGERRLLVDGRLADAQPGIPARVIDGLTGETLGDLAGGMMDSVRFNSSTRADAAVVTYSSGWAPGHFALPEIVTSDGRATPLSGPVENFSSATADSAVSFSPDASGFVVRYEDGHTEVWDRRGQPRSLVDLGLGITTSWVGTSGARLVTQDRSGAAYLVDLELLRSLPTDGPLTEDRLIDGLCGVVSRAGHPDRVPNWLRGRCP
jgi:WD40 repeat protein